jgi:peptidoglycan/LPS O-acetylase OafA/YrhL
MKRIQALDALRGILACCVVAQHVCAAFHSEALVFLSRPAVLIFFIMSGFVLARSYDGRFIAFIAKRFVRLWPLYAVCMLIGSLVVGVALHPGDLLWYPMLAFRAYPAADGAAWSLYYEAWATPLLPLAFWVAKRGGRGLALLLPWASMGLAFIDPRLTCTPFFLAGVVAAQFEVPLPNYLPNFALWLGKVSFSLYLTHSILFSAFVQMFGPWGAVAALPAVLPVAWIAWRYVEVPSIAWSRAIGRMSFQSIQIA